MGRRLEFQIVPKTFHAHDSKRIQQGEVCAGPESQSTILKSCVCVGFHHKAKSIGAISHITGFHSEGGHSVEGALREMHRGLRRHDVDLEDCHCFVIGGATRARHVYDDVIRELRARNITYTEYDVLGDFHRKLLFDPALGKISLFKQPAGEQAKKGREAASIYSSDTSFKCFHDPKRRLITGASLFFRNRYLLDALARHVVPGVLALGDRFHVWCAGCSNGMEVYSITMAILDRVKRSGRTNIDLRILGSDISTEALETAQAGCYSLSEQSARAHEALFNAYTERVDKHNVRMGSELRNRVTFRQRDLRQGSRNHLFELVVCDHVLQYFEPTVQLEMLAPLARAVQPGGFAYISSPSPLVPEIICKTHGFERLERSFYKKP